MSRYALLCPLVSLSLLASACSLPGGDGDGPADGDHGEGSGASYDEDLRPQFHYSPTEGDMADPNGLVYHDGEYHLFHQQWGTWAHAVSPDLVHWEELPTALEHDELGQALSGSAVVDHDNTSGLFPEGEGGIVTVHTNTEGGEAQSIAYSEDGRTFERYDGNPVLPNDGREDFRDPQVFWHEQSGSWIMAVSSGQKVEIFGSPDLLEWEKLSEFGDDQGMQTAVWECPELFELPVDGDPDDTRWVLAVSVGSSEETGGSTAQYFVGDFDGETFTSDDPPERERVVDAGQDFYAAQSFAEAPDDRRVWLAWVGNWAHPYAAPTEGWTNHMSVPREVTLRSTGDGDVELAQAPVDELDGLRGEPVHVPEGEIDGLVPVDFEGRSFEFEAEIDLGEAEEAGLRVFDGDASGEESWFAIGGNTEHGEFVMDRANGGPQTLHDPELEEDAEFGVRRAQEHEPEDGVLRMRGYVDESSVEVFVDDGSLTGTMLAYPEPGDAGVTLYASGGAARLESLTIHPMEAVR
ncbi:glycoside hydrolase family 32 protein [Nocardiopsis sp. HNM0947]|uniref:Glycoside hydrolase family 32 protein n=1 Tax=Nocardiopsis coralli TaxID=2772213 RepID=A0ABR9P455_9ACTN|nr:glycoside hydrolase family 32 protein [Nocardiopsis coralli]MBE2998627.1 glycoside hydrolase family 32 protein [Nocardiopsis coralli]